MRCVKKFFYCKVYIKKKGYMLWVCNVYYNYYKSLIRRKKKVDIFFYRCYDVKIFFRVFLKNVILNNKIRVCEVKFVYVYMYVVYFYKNR